MIPFISSEKGPVITVTARQATTGYLVIPNSNINNVSFTVDTSQPYQYNVFSALKTQTGVEYKGMYITAELDVSVQLKIGYGNNGDAVRVLKVLETSKEFVVAAFNSSSISSDYKDNVLSIVATEDDTNVKIIEYNGEATMTVLHEETLQRFGWPGLVLIARIFYNSKCQSC